MHITWSMGVAVVVALAGAVLDWRTGRIPSWLTMPVAFLAVLHGGISALVGIALCTACPLLMFVHGGLAGGDVKIYAALGALLGMVDGLYAQGVTALVILMLPPRISRPAGPSILVGVLAIALLRGLTC